MPDTEWTQRHRLQMIGTTSCLKTCCEQLLLHVHGNDDVASHDLTHDYMT